MPGFASQPSAIAYNRAPQAQGQGSWFQARLTGRALFLSKALA